MWFFFRPCIFGIFFVYLFPLPCVTRSYPFLLDSLPFLRSHSTAFRSATRSSGHRGSTSVSHSPSGASRSPSGASHSPSGTAGGFWGGSNDTDEACSGFFAAAGCAFDKGDALCASGGRYGCRHLSRNGPGSGAGSSGSECLCSALYGVSAGHFNSSPFARRRVGPPQFGRAPLKSRSNSVRSHKTKNS